METHNIPSSKNQLKQRQSIKSTMLFFINQNVREMHLVKYNQRIISVKEIIDSIHAWLYDQNILHSVGEPNRHNQLANAENLNKTLGRLLAGYMNSKED